MLGQIAYIPSRNSIRKMGVPATFYLSRKSSGKIAVPVIRKTTFNDFQHAAWGGGNRGRPFRMRDGLRQSCAGGVCVLSGSVTATQSTSCSCQSLVLARFWPVSLSSPSSVFGRRVDMWASRRCPLKCALLKVVWEVGLSTKSFLLSFSF